eukprot:CAMPEP_0182559636 /NCGR_PEP_ID=MMETSP1324-20130603/2686_1 /TAXON_ID=236786 /ORGANISM="Florenciella sp., Strain RCC1587" /LENGTH=85 /DNA_ID=CAMNT_0024771917 /DNA_START=116 /DNA_END=373 /DNA_ORIENTATION=+
MGKGKKQEQPEATLSKKEDKKIRKMKAKITYHEARGGHRPGQIGDVRPTKENGLKWSPNAEWDTVQELKQNIIDIEKAAQARTWA